MPRAYVPDSGQQPLFFNECHHAIQSFQRLEVGHHKGLEPFGGGALLFRIAAHDVQIGADTLWLDAQAQNAPDENTRIFAQWRARHGLSLSQAAQALGMTSRTMSAYGTGARPVPRYIALACKGWEAEHRRAA